MTVTTTTTTWLNKRAYLTEDTNNTNVGFFNFVTFELLYAIVPVMTFIDLLTLFLRVASIRERRSRPQADDYSAILASLFAIATGVIVLYGAVKRVTGRHDWDPWPLPEGPWPRSDYTLDTKDTDHPVFNPLYAIHVQINYILNCLQGVGIGVVRLAFLFLFRKLFLYQGRGYIILIDALIGAVTLFMLAYTGTQVFVCGVHPTAQWTNHEIAAEYCFTNVTYNFGVSIVTVVLDVTVFLLPMYPLLRITQTREEELYSGGLLLRIPSAYPDARDCSFTPQILHHRLTRGYFRAVVSSIFSLVLATPFFLYQDSYIYTWLRDHGAGDGDAFGWSGTTTFWSYMELAVGAAVCNLPIISRFLIRRWWDVSKQATVQTMNQIVTRKLWARDHAPESYALQSDTLPIYVAKTRSGATETTNKSEQESSGQKYNYHGYVRDVESNDHWPEHDGNARIGTAL
ncbi:hypothetical protein GCG54_00014542 [Colletotrichum gloeosporioides]|uniref:Rhodopsin domain-containing protein n=1 Tax=Colletotrichum gloeosporioides TaxID=474922 RepID=A0A8H4FRH1_COLGL|nr:uncharacterized protein GCG54_00014542 [Colletotrichum gloeosporioides]KAF3811790.1 hypothetical protein GCG54_00014542 [Colletotrichum gloeosporioides]